MAIRTVNFSVSAGGISPAARQFGGVQGDDNVTRVIFNIDSGIISEMSAAGKLKYRIDGYDAYGNCERSEVSVLEGSTIEYDIGDNLTRYGGDIRLLLILSALEMGDDGSITSFKEMYSFPVSLEIRATPEYIPAEEKVSLTALATGAKAAATAAEEYAASAYASRLISEGCAANSADAAAQAQEYKNQAFEYLQMGKRQFASAVRNTAVGESITVLDVSSVEHELDIKLSKKNLIPYPYTHGSATISGLDFTVDENGVITVNGTAVGGVTYYLSKNISLPVGTYTISMNVAQGAPVDQIGIRSNDYSWSGYAVSGSASTFAVTNSSDAELFLMFRANSNCNNLVIRPMIEVGVASGEFAPIIADFSAVKVSRQGKNLCDFKKFKPYNNGTIMLLENGFTYTGSYYLSLDGSFLMPGYRYFFRWNYQVTDNITPIYRIQYADGTYSSTIQNGAGLTVTQNVKAIMLYPEMTSTVHTTTFTNLQIEIGTTATDYEPYVEPQTEEADPYGTVAGITSLHPNMTLTASETGVILSCTYNADTKMYIDNKFAELQAAIISTGGNV